MKTRFLPIAATAILILPLLVSCRSETPRDTGFSADAVTTLREAGVITSAEARDFRGSDVMLSDDFSVWIDLAQLAPEGFATLQPTFTLNELLEYMNVLLDIEGVTAVWGAVDIARFFGVIPQGGVLSLNAPVTRADAAYFIAAAMELLSQRADGLTAFYALGAFSQVHMIDHLDSVSMGWSRFDIIDGEAVFNLSAYNNNEYSFPAGYYMALDRARDNNVPIYLMVAANMRHHGGMTTSQYILLNPEMHAAAIDDLVYAAHNGVISPISGQRVFFDGITMDFEEMRGAAAREAYSQFIIELRSRLPDGFTLLICVHPARRGQPYFDAFDFRVLGEHSDGLIVMAHDYYAKSLTDAEMARGIVDTPPSPIADVFDALYLATHPETGTCPSRVWLAMSFTGVQWQRAGGVTLNRRPFTPLNPLIEARLLDEGTTVTRGMSGNPRARWEIDGVENVLFYEDALSMMQRQRLADMFGIAGLSLWRLGNVPDGPAEINMDGWSRLLAHRAH